MANGDGNGFSRLHKIVGFLSATAGLIVIVYWIMSLFFVTKEEAVLLKRSHNYLMCTVYCDQCTCRVLLPSPGSRYQVQ